MTNNKAAESDPADGLEAGLVAAIADLENAAVERARTLIAAEAESLREHIRKLEEQIARLEQRPKPTAFTGTATPNPVATGGGPSAPVKLPPVRRTAKTSRPQDLPPLPAKRTLATLGQYLNALGFALVSKRASGGGAWVFEPEEKFGHVVDHLKKNGVGVLRYPRGRKRYSGDHYEIDPSKVLPEK